MSLKTFYIVDRQQWGALPPASKRSVERPALYVRTIVLSEERKCYTEDECFEQLRDLQKRDMERGLTDIRPNFLIADDGRVYEGRGWFINPPDHHICHYNNHFIEIAHLGGRPDEEFRVELIRLKMHLLQYGMNNKYLSRYHSIIT